MIICLLLISKEVRHCVQVWPVLETGLICDHQQLNMRSFRVVITERSVIQPPIVFS